METELNEVFLHNLHQIYFIEKALVDTLQKLQKMAKDKMVKEALEMHRKETMQHVKNVEKIFEMVNLKMMDMKMYSLDAMGKELDNVLKEVSPETRDFFILEAAAKSERIEITHYESLILATKDLGLPDEGEILSLLRSNLADEEKTLGEGMTMMKSQVPLWKRKIH